MNPRTALVITSISAPNRVLVDYAEGCRKNRVEYVVIGDTKSPADFQLEGCDFYGVPAQKELGFELAAITPERHYSRKNLGYLIAMRNGAEIIVETDDDNFAMPTFWEDRTDRVPAHLLENKSWVNLYSYFSKVRIWPRGFALEHLHDPAPSLGDLGYNDVYCPIQQGLANENPDVDAIYRLILPLPVNFDDGPNVAVGAGTWCPFNSQNTTWFQPAFLLLYLPSYCSFRMTDIWRSFVTERICWENGWNILFHNSTVWQERNEHNLMRDFAEEIPGYVNNKKIADLLSALSLKAGAEHIGDNLILCYEALIQADLVGAEEMTLLKAWIKDATALLPKG